MGDGGASRQRGRGGAESRDKGKMRSSRSDGESHRCTAIARGDGVGPKHVGRCGQTIQRSPSSSPSLPPPSPSSSPSLPPPSPSSSFVCVIFSPFFFWGVDCVQPNSKGEVRRVSKIQKKCKKRTANQHCSPSISLCHVSRLCCGHYPIEGRG